MAWRCAPRIPVVMFKIAYQELCTVARDKGILIFILFVPLVYPLLYSYVYTNEVVREVPAVVVDESRSAASRRFIRMVDASPDVAIAYQCGSLAEAEEHLKRREAYGILRIPSTFTTDLQRGDQTTVGLYADMSSMLYYKAMLLTVTNASLEMNKDIKVTEHLPATTDRAADISRTPIEYDYVALYNPQSGFAAFLIPPVLMLIIQQTLLLGIGMAMGDRREHRANQEGGRPGRTRQAWPPGVLGLRPRRGSAAGTAALPICGRALPYFLLYMLLAVYMFTVVNNMFALPRFGDYWTFVVFAAVYILACIFLGMTLGHLVHRREDCIMLFVFLSVPMLFLSGVSWPGAAMPKFWKYVSYLFPSTFGMNGYVRITSMGASLSQVAFEFKGLLIQTVVYFTAAWLIQKREKHKKQIKFA